MRISKSTAFCLLSGALFLGFIGLLYLTANQNYVDSRLILGLSGFVALVIAAEGYPLQIPFGNAYLGLSGTIFMALVVLFTPFWASIAAFIGFMIAQAFLNKRSLSKVIFNASQNALSVFASAVVFISINGSNGLNGSFAFILAFALATLVYWFSNTWLVSLGAHVLYGEPAHRFWERNFKWMFVYELTSAPLAIMVAFAYSELALVGLLLVALPILMVRLAYSQYIELKKTYRETVRTLVKIIEMHDPYTAGHSDRVAIYSRRLCEAMRLSPGQTEKIELAAYLHDLGKINLDLSGIVRKAGKLTDEERRLIRLHSVVSADLANQVSYFRGEIEAMIRHHHENWDGSGYPHGLQGEQIPLGSRVILLADAFDAMTTSRVYRDALDLDHVKDEFRKFSGIQFDPSIVPVFLEEVVGDGSDLVRQPMDQPLEGKRAKEAAEERSVEVHPISRRGTIG